jgi:polysaccharide export outer membrane protein
MNMVSRLVVGVIVVWVSASGLGAQSAPAREEFVIGPSDVLEVSYWKDKDHSAEVTVRPDGFISLPLINDVQASGLTPAMLAEQIRLKAAEFLQSPTVTVFVKQINSRKVFITGEVDKPGAYTLTGPITVLQLIAMAGGLSDFADREHITVVRATTGGAQHVVVNYKKLARLQDLSQNIVLLPGDTVVVR